MTGISFTTRQAGLFSMGLDDQPHHQDDYNGDEEQDIVSVYHQVKQIFSKGDMEITKFATNSTWIFNFLLFTLEQ